MLLLLSYAAFLLSSKASSARCSACMPPANLIGGQVTVGLPLSVEAGSAQALGCVETVEDETNDLESWSHSSHSLVEVSSESISF